MPMGEGSGISEIALVQALILLAAAWLLGRRIVAGPIAAERQSCGFLLFAAAQLAAAALNGSGFGMHAVAACVALGNASLWAGVLLLRAGQFPWPALAAGLVLAGVLLILPAAALPLLPWLAALPALGAARAFDRLGGRAGEALAVVTLLAALAQAILLPVGTGAMLPVALVALSLGLAFGLGFLDPAPGALATLGLRAGREDLRRLHHGLPTVIFLRSVAPDGSSRVIYKGGDIEWVTGWSPAALEAEGGLEALAARNATPFRSILPRVLRNGSATFDWALSRPDGAPAWVRAHLRRLSGSPEEGGTVAGCVFDVTAEREAHARASSAARLAALGEASAGLAHELRQPLATIMLAAETAQLELARGDASAANDRLGPVVDQAERAGALIEHLRRFARGDSSDEAVEPVCVGRALEGALALIGSRLRAERIEVVVAVGERPPRVLAQLIPLEQVLLNLLANARDAIAAQPGQRPRRIRIAGDRVPPEARMVRLTVADTGGGIPVPVLPRLFVGFVSTKGPEHGTGLGLSICYDLVRRMGGTIEAANAAEGAVFTITLRAASGDNDAAGGRAGPAESSPAPDSIAALEGNPAPGPVAALEGNPAPGPVAAMVCSQVPGSTAAGESAPTPASARAAARAAAQ